MKRVWILTVVAIVLIIVDQAIKISILNNFTESETYKVIPGFFSLAFVKNTGAAFGFGQGGPEWFRLIFFLALPVIFCGWVGFMLYRSRTGPVYLSIAYALIIAGAIGNLIDRFRLGYVVDMFMFYWKKEEHHFHVFNIADSCITIAAALLIWDFIKNRQSNNELVKQENR